jgi:hypothetical protein
MNNENQIHEEEFGEVIDIAGASVKPLMPATIDINSQTGERVELNPLEKIKFAAERFGITLNNPDKSCKKCFGRGYVGIDSKTQIPISCKCIIPKAMRAASNNQFIPTNRKAKRVMDKMQKKGQIQISPDASNV